MSEQPTPPPSPAAPRPKRRLHLPVHYLVLVLAAVVALVVLLQLFGRTDKVLIGWLIGFLVVSRAVDFVYRRRRKRTPPRA